MLVLVLILQQKDEGFCRFVLLECTHLAFYPKLLEDNKQNYSVTLIYSVELSANNEDLQKIICNRVVTYNCSVQNFH